MRGNALSHTTKGDNRRFSEDCTAWPCQWLLQIDRRSHNFIFKQRRHDDKGAPGVVVCFAKNGHRYTGRFFISGYLARCNFCASMIGVLQQCFWGEGMIDETHKSKVITARFSNDALRRVEEAVNALGCTRNELVVAGTLAEIERRTKNIQRGEALQELAPVFAN